MAHGLLSPGSPVVRARNILSPLADLDARPGEVLHVNHRRPTFTQDDPYHAVRHVDLKGKRKLSGYTRFPFIAVEKKHSELCATCEVQNNSVKD